MPSPFPGMDPYLEHPQTWSNVHHRLITAIAVAIAPLVRPKYRVVVEEATYQSEGRDSVLIGKSDVVLAKGRTHASTALDSAVTMQPPMTQPIPVSLPVPMVVRQGYLEIREIANDAVITVLEVLSLVNKRSGKGRSDYLAKRDRVLASATHWVEIDLLRQWEPMPLTLAAPLQTDYRILVSASEQRPGADLYAFNVQDSIPIFALPLGPDDPWVNLDLKILIDQIYDQSGYDLVIDYRQDPKPLLSAAGGEWLESWLKEKGLR